MDVAYAQPGASLQAYQGIVVQPVAVFFQKNWARSAAIAAGTRLYPRDADLIREEMADVVDREIRREFEQGGWRVVDTAGAGVLELEVRVVDLYLNATRVENTREVGLVASSWARALRRQLTLARVPGDRSNGRP